MKHHLRHVLLLTGAALCFYACAASTPPITHPDGAPLENSIARLETVTLGGVEQTILIRGRDTSKPVLLFLHGGPGFPMMPLFPHFNGELEKHFVVVNWDQRGAGKSYSKHIPAESFTIEQFVEDAHQLVTWLKERFHQEKVFLVGISWGSGLGMYVIDKYPEDFHAYVGSGQLADVWRGEQISYDYVLEQARREDNRKAIRQLEAIGPPEQGRYPGGRKDLSIQRRWLSKYGGLMYGEKGGGQLIKVYFRSQEYTFGDMARMMKGFSRTIDLMYDKYVDINLFEQIPAVEVPVYFIQGRHDNIVPFELTEEYFEVLQAPHKELIWFENSAHTAPLEEPEKFNRLMIEKVLPENLPAAEGARAN